MLFSRRFVRRALAVATGVALLATAVATATPATAADASATPAASTTEASLFEVTSTQLGVTVDDAALAEALTSDLAYAIDNGMINAQVLSGVKSGKTAKDLAKEFKANTAAQEKAWTSIATVMTAAFETIQSDFDTCRASYSPASVCASKFGDKFLAAITQVDPTVADLVTGGGGSGSSGGSDSSGGAHGNSENRGGHNGENSDSTGPGNSNKGQPKQ